MTHSLRRLERALVRERVDLIVTAVVNDFLDRWSRALADGWPTPPVLDFSLALSRAGVHPFRCPGVTNYLADCAREQTLPDADRLVRILLPQKLP
ncbi:MAG: hypothetical protein O3A47_00930 [Chloroflexi bacterium]|nr:hypothetical protein [Chloroflexota bacterium]